MLEKITIKAVGDICPGDASISGLGIRSLSKKYGVTYPFEFAKDDLGNADIVIGNLEGILTSRAYSKIIRFCGVLEFAQALRNAGFTVVSVANNHIFELGIPGFNETVSALENSGILICGRRGKKEYYSEPVIVNIKGKTIGLLSYNWVGIQKFPDADTYIAQSNDSVVNYTWNRDPRLDKQNRENIQERNINVLGDIRRLKRTVDHVVLIPHWGFEFVHVPPYGVVQEAHSFIDAGADCIIGIHPHVLQGYENYKGKMIFYSLGNFIFDMPNTESKYSALLQFSFGENDGTDYSFDYFRINKKHQPVPVSKNEARHVNRIVAESNCKLQSADLSIVLNDDLIYEAFEKQYDRQKILNIVRHFYLLPIYPFIALVIIKKFINFTQLILLRFKGKKIRW